MQAFGSALAIYAKLFKEFRLSMNNTSTKFICIGLTVTSVNVALLLKKSPPLFQPLWTKSLVLKFHQDRQPPRCTSAQNCNGSAGISSELLEGSVGALHTKRVTKVIYLFPT